MEEPTYTFFFLKIIPALYLKILKKNCKNSHFTTKIQIWSTNFIYEYKNRTELGFILEKTEQSNFNFFSPLPSGKKGKNANFLPSGNAKYRFFFYRWFGNSSSWGMVLLWPGSLALGPLTPLDLRSPYLRALVEPCSGFPMLVVHLLSLAQK